MSIITTVRTKCRNGTGGGREREESEGEGEGREGGIYVHVFLCTKNCEVKYSVSHNLKAIFGKIQVNAKRGKQFEVMVSNLKFQFLHSSYYK